MTNIIAHLRFFYTVIIINKCDKKAFAVYFRVYATKKKKEQNNAYDSSGQQIKLVYLLCVSMSGEIVYAVLVSGVCIFFYMGKYKSDHQKEKVVGTIRRAKKRSSLVLRVKCYLKV